MVGSPSGSAGGCGSGRVENVKNNLEIVPVKWIDQVLELALEKAPEPIADEEPQGKGAEVKAPVPAPVSSPDVLPH